MDNYADIIDFLFNKKEDEELFDLEDAEREKLRKNSQAVYEEITIFINKKVHPKCRKKLMNLLHKYDDAECAYLRKENELLYRNGIADSIRFILTALSIK